MDTSILTPSQWGMILILLSLDIVAPLVESMGIKLSKIEKFRQILRQLIIENRQAYQHNPEEIPPLAGKVFHTINSVFGKNDAENLYKWSATVYNEVHADQPQWSAWEIVFFRALHNPAIKKRIKIPKEKLNNLLEQYQNLTEIKDIEQKIDEVKKQILSDWDLEMYSIHQFNNDNDFNNPFEIVLSCIRMNRFQTFWDKLLDELSPEEKTIIYQNGKEIIEEMEVWMPENESLKHPDQLHKDL